MAENRPLPVPPAPEFHDESLSPDALVNNRCHVDLGGPHSRYGEHFSAGLILNVAFTAPGPEDAPHPGEMHVCRRCGCMFWVPKGEGNG